MKAIATLIAAAVAATALAGAADRADARKATTVERTAIVAAWERALGLDERAVCSRGWIVRVAQSKPRLASITGSNRFRARHGCLVGDGFGLLRRPTPKSTRWRVIYQGSDPAPCRLTSPRVSRQLGLGGDCR